MLKVKKPLVTIGMPVYNGEKYIRQSLDSILAQTFTDYELIISDNASMDSTEDICREYLGKDQRIQYHRFNENMGASKNYNYLVGVASGKYFRWSNYDDISAATSLEKCVDLLNHNESVILVYPRTVIIDDKGNVISNYDDNLDLRSSDPVERFIHFYKYIGLSNVLYGLMRTDILRKTSLFGNYIASDITLIGELSLYGEFHEINEYLFLRRFHPKASSSDKSKESQQIFFDPKTKGKVAIPSLRNPYQHVLSILKSNIGSGKKINLVFFIFMEGIRDRNNIWEELCSNLKDMYQRLRHS